jgi:hypothetical protein
LRTGFFGFGFGFGFIVGLAEAEIVGDALTVCFEVGFAVALAVALAVGVGVLVAATALPADNEKAIARTREIFFNVAPI